MKKFLIPCITAFFCFSALAQERFTIQMQPGEDINSLVTHSKYVFPEFRTGTVLYTDNTTTKAQMNYDMTTGEMHFSDGAGKMMAITNPTEITSILFEDREFIYSSKGYLEVLTYYNDKALLLHRRINAVKDKPTGGYGMASNVSAVERSTGMVATGDLTYTMEIQETGSVSLTMIQTVYLQSGKSVYAKGSEKNFLQLFGKDKKTAIRDYVTTNRLNLKIPTDLIQLFNYCVETL